MAEGVLAGDPPVFEVPAVPRPWRVLVDYARLGVGHILTGPDHLLFVFGLVLLAGASRRLLTTVTAFTLGHSVTLAAAVLGLVRLPAAPIEVAIAASVFVLAVELARDPGRPSAIRRRPWVMAFVSGCSTDWGSRARSRKRGCPPARSARAARLQSRDRGRSDRVRRLRARDRQVAAAAGAPDAVLGPVGTVYAMGSLAALWWIERTATLFR